MAYVAPKKLNRRHPHVGRHRPLGKVNYLSTGWGVPAEIYFRRKRTRSAKKYHILGPRTHFDARKRDSGNFKIFWPPFLKKFLTSFRTFQDFFQKNSHGISQNASNFFPPPPPRKFSKIFFFNFLHLSGHFKTFSKKIFAWNLSKRVDFFFAPP